VTKADGRIPRTFRLRDWVELTPAFLQIASFASRKVGLAEACCNQDLREGRLRAALVANGVIKMLPEPSYWLSRPVRAPQVPAEGVRVEPYEEGTWFIWKADLDAEYPTNPTTPAVVADRQLDAAGESAPSQSLRQPPPAVGARPEKRRGGPQSDRLDPVVRALYPPGGLPEPGRFTKPEIVRDVCAALKANGVKDNDMPDRKTILRKVGLLK
jgi:hypothetical protein